MKTWQSILGFNPEKHSVRTEFIAGVTTFLTMSYILAVNPDILAAAGMDKGAVFTATALSSAVATLLIAFLAKLPFAQAPSMGINAFFAFTLVQGMGYSWQTALAAVFVECTFKNEVQFILLHSPYFFEAFERVWGLGDGASQKPTAPPPRQKHVRSRKLPYSTSNTKKGVPFEDSLRLIIFVLLCINN